LIAIAIVFGPDWLSAYSILNGLPDASTTEFFPPPSPLERMLQNETEIIRSEPGLTKKQMESINEPGRTATSP